MGRDYEVKVELGEYNFPSKTYGHFSLPAGKYEAVRLVIGRGEGENWWCVLFPPLCFVDISSNATTEQEATKVYKETQWTDMGIINSSKDEGVQIQIKSKFMEILNKSKGFLTASKGK